MYSHANELRAAGRDIVAGVPFGLRLTMEGQLKTLECDHILRLLPDRRLTLSATLEGRRVLVKLFIGTKRERYYARELQGIQLLQAKGIDTPVLLHRAYDSAAGLAYLIIEYVEQFSLEQMPSTNKKIQCLAPFIAKMHNVGVVQRDLHLNNFLFSELGVFAVDGDAVQSHSRISAKQRLKDLARLISQCNDSDEALEARCLSAYLANSKTKPVINLQTLKIEVQRARNKALKQRLKKALRDCTEYHCSASYKRFFVCRRSSFSPELGALVENMDAWMETGERLKTGHSSTVCRVELNGKKYVIKRYNIKSAYHALKRAFRTSRARKSWLNEIILDHYNIPAARNAAFLEERYGPVRGRAYLIMEFVEGLLLADVEQPLSAEIREQVICNFGKLASAGIVHGDTKATNFILAKSSPKQDALKKAALKNDEAIEELPRLTFLDLDAMRLKPVNFKAAFNKDVRRFLANFKPDPALQGSLQSLPVVRSNEAV